MKSSCLVALIAMTLSAGALAADAGEDLFNKNKCGSCHKLDAKAVGPSVKAFAAKYAGNKDAVAGLEKKVRTGGAGVWGSMPMPRVPNTVSDEDIKTMVAWMLAH
jgi:cytochrome c